MGAIQGRGKGGGGGGGGRGGLLDAIQGTSMRDNNNNKSRLSLLNLTKKNLFRGERKRWRKRRIIGCNRRSWSWRW